MLTIRSKSHPYRVVECDDARSTITGIPDSETAFFLVDRNVGKYYETQFAGAVPASQTYVVDATEHAKSYDQLEPIFCWLLERKIRRSSNLVVIGGGVLQDIGCFIASVLMRGVRWTLIPTTLLAQCDSCIGSKSSLNVNRFKNQLGTFYPPHEIRMSFDYLKSLQQEEIYSGLGEAIKLHLIDGEESATELRKMLAPTELALLPLNEIVWRSLAIKKRFIEEDEFDLGSRNILNYGHTFAHAFESSSRYAIPHGIAVTIGVVFATYFAVRLKMAESSYFEHVLDWTRPYFEAYSPTLSALPLESIVDAMKQDKKNKGEQVTFILSRRPGIMEKVALDATAVPILLEDCRNLLKP